MKDRIIYILKKNFRFFSVKYIRNIDYPLLSCLIAVPEVFLYNKRNKIQKYGSTNFKTKRIIL